MPSALTTDQNSLPPRGAASSLAFVGKALAPGRVPGGRIRVIGLAVADVTLALGLFSVFGVVAGGALSFSMTASRIGPFDSSALAFAMFVLLAGLGAGIYRRSRTTRAGLPAIGRLVLVSLAAAWATSLLAAAREWDFDQTQIVAVWAALPLAMFAVRWLVAASAAPPRERVLVLGGGVVAQRVADLATRHPESHMEIVGRLDDDPGGADCSLPLLGRVDDLARVMQGGFDRVIIAFSSTPDHLLADVVRQCDLSGVRVDVVPRMFDLVDPLGHASALGALPLARVTPQRPSFMCRFGKRTLDILGSAGAILLLSPVFLVVALAILADEGRPVFYRQLRVGRGGREFHVVKFCTMVRDADARLQQTIDEMVARGVPMTEVVDLLKGDDDPRITRVGRTLRATSLDELPQLFNVLVGQMSLVGPRPLRPFEMPAVIDWQMRRQNVRPGITGLWQVLGRSDVQWKERMQLDYSYAQHWSLPFDLRILWRTIPAVLKKRGAV